LYRQGKRALHKASRKPKTDFSRIHPGFDYAKKFAERLLENLEKKKIKVDIDSKVKVALIDDGVDPEFRSVGPRLAKSGYPRGTLDGNMIPFYTSTTEHGSKMAWIIQTICPFVQIYVAKIDTRDSTDLFHPQFSVAKAEPVCLDLYSFFCSLSFLCLGV
jgi:hypothetical protein